MAKVYRLFLQTVGLTAFTVYCCWNVYWLAQGKIPPALLLALTGLPAPTTGGTRSFWLLWQGQWWESLRANPITVPFLLLLLFTLTWSLGQLLNRRRLRLPTWAAWAWGLLLIVGWVAKLLGDPSYW